MNFKRFLPLCLFLLVGASAFAQFTPLVPRKDSVSLNDLLAKSVKYTNDYPVEKVYVHFDKPYYAAGDTVWLKSYVTVDQHAPSTMSKVVYIDMYNEQDSLVASQKLPLVDGMAAGNFLLSPQLKQGNYRLRGYTQWMLNFDPAYLFNKVITIGNQINKEVSVNVNFTGGTTAQTPVTAKVQFTDAQGKPLADKRVNWHVETSHEDTGKGRVNTDANGYATITLPPASPLALGSSVLFTEIDLDAKKPVNTFFLKAASTGKDVQFFPEGGDLIAGIPSKVAVKAVRANGLGLDFKGTVVDNEGKEVTTFESQHLGMGLLLLQPEVGKTYKANISFADGTQGTYNIPRISQSGINLSAMNGDGENLNIKIAANDAYFKANQNKTYYIVAQCGGFIKYAAQTKLQSSVYQASIPKSKFGTGILQITLFGSNGIPISERLVFIQRNDLMTLNVTTDKPQYGRRQPVKLNISAKNGTAPADAGLSVAVIDEKKVPVDEDGETTILTSLLLTSDLRGYVEKPNYYFNKKDAKTVADLDVLMLTQGYRRFSYRDIVAGRMPKVTYMPESGITISGTLRNSTGLPIFKGNVRLFVPDKNFSAETITDAEGVFKFNNVVVNDTMKVTLNARNNVNANNLMIMVDGQKEAGPSRIVNMPDERMNIDSLLRPYLDNSKKEYETKHMLHEVVIKSTVQPQRPRHTEYPSLTGLAMEADHVINGDRFKGCNFFAECLATSALGVTYVDQKFYVTRSYNQGDKREMAIFLDGLQVDAPAMQTVNANDIESVEVFMNDGLSGINRRDNTNGVLVINKKKKPKGTKLTMDQIRELLPPPYIVSYVPRGYNMVREFYSPKYEVGKPSGVGIDLRSTIYWNPKVTTDKTTGNVTLQYYNADGNGTTYRVVVEGMDKQGNLGRSVYRYRVQ
ncbi:hypothetical protein C8P68_107102 [Mucilaginibacter yixingensis]|uniref:Carboxypeptidase regulatory-like domain-containing protein n=1 Tax=Mucilaginibacter yixingensis TaxID=1295612 RepID=A0A2T5J6B4_9SPHI|nr:hypothetical protein [Mucilaginibacter yixingensis]PTQ94039.1 hypothetical protein C8P68_107102 [Mucilaginibacter yixingensis]